MGWSCLPLWHYCCSTTQGSHQDPIKHAHATQSHREKIQKKEMILLRSLNFAYTKQCLRRDQGAWEPWAENKSVSSVWDRQQTPGNQGNCSALPQIGCLGYPFARSSIIIVNIWLELIPQQALSSPHPIGYIQSFLDNLNAVFIRSWAQQNKKLTITEGLMSNQGTFIHLILQMKSE